MNHEDNSRIKLKVLTTTGINILCTALRNQKISQWLPHFEEAYREVKEEQGEDQYSRQTFIRAVRVKKEDYYIANSQIIGDVFVDNDEVCCEIVGDGGKKKSKAEKQKKKQKEKKEKNQQRTEVKTEEKINKINHQSNSVQDKDNKINETNQRNQQPKKTPIKQTPSKQKRSQPSNSNPKASVLHKIDLSKLKNILVKEQHSHPNHNSEQSS